MPKKKDSVLIAQELRSLRGRFMEADILRAALRRADAATSALDAARRELAESGDEYVCRLDAALCVVSANPAFLHAHGLCDEALGECLFPVALPEAGDPGDPGDPGSPDAPEARQVRQTIVRLGRERAMTSLVHRAVMPDGRVRWQEWLYRAILDEAGDVAGYQAVGRDVTEVREAVEGYRRAEEKYRAIFENAPLGIFRTTAAGRFEEINQVMARMLGFADAAQAMAEVADIGRQLYDDPASRTRLLALLAESPGSIVYETQFRRRDGGRFLGRLHVSAVRDAAGGVTALIGLMDDITERRRMEEELRRSERVSRTLLNATTESAFLVDVDGTILAVNDIGARRLGGTPQSIAGRNFHEFQSWELFEQGMERVFEAYCERRPVRFEDERSGIVHDVMVSPVFDDAGGVDKVAIFAQDITERRRLERLREDVERITRHDMKTPLIGIVGFAQLLLKSHNLTDKQREYVAYIQNSGRQMMDFIKKSLDYFKMEQRSYVLSPRPVDMARVFRRIHDDLRPLAVRKSVLVCFAMDGRDISLKSPIVFFGEEDHLENLFANLIKNAVEAAPEDSMVTVSIRPGGRVCEVDVHNPGVIPEAARARFFSRYNTAGKEGGTGLGTYVARLIAETHGGGVRYTTSPEEGTHLIVSLPVGPAACAGEGI